MSDWAALKGIPFVLRSTPPWGCRRHVPREIRADLFMGPGHRHRGPAMELVCRLATMKAEMVISSLALSRDRPKLQG